MPRLGKRERAALAAKGLSRRGIVADNLRCGPMIDVDKSLRKSNAYNPGAERLTIYGRCRVIHNAQGSEPVKSPFKRRFNAT